MSQSKLESIADDLMTALGNISIANGYNRDVSSVARWDPATRDTSSGSLIELLAGAAPLSADRNGEEWVVRQTVYIDWVIVDQSTDGKTLDEEFSDAYHDLAKATVGLFLQRDRFLDFVCSQQPLVDQQVADTYRLGRI